MLLKSTALCEMNCCLVKLKIVGLRAGRVLCEQTEQMAMTDLQEHMGTLKK